MAEGISGSVAFTSSGKTLRVYYVQTFTPGVAQSTVTITKVTLQSDITYGGSFFFDGKILVGGQVVFSRSVAGSDGGVTVNGNENIINLCTNGTVTVNHSAAADISIQLEKNTYGTPFFYNAYSSGFSISAGSRTVTLAAIPMASGISVSAAAFALGSPMKVALTKAAPELTDTVTWKCGSLSGTIVQNTTATGLSWTPPVSLASQAPSGTSVSVTLTTVTKSGGTESGSSSVTVSCAIPESVRPTVSFAVSDEMGYLAAFGSYIKTQSKARVVTTAAGAQGSSITDISVACGSLTGSGGSLLFALPHAGTVSVSVTVTDSRGRTASASGEIYVADYSPPSPKIMELYRCDESGAEDPDGAYACVGIGFDYASLGGKNTISMTLQYRAMGTTAWTEVNIGVRDSVIFEANTGIVYQVRLAASDSFTSASSGTSTLPAAFALLDFDRNNKAIGIGMRAGTASAISMGLTVQMNNKRIRSLATPSATKDAATKAYVDGKHVAVYNVSLAWTDGIATYENSAIKATSTCIVQWRAGAVSTLTDSVLGTTSYAGYVKIICKSGKTNITLPVNILIFN